MASARTSRIAAEVRSAISGALVRGELNDPRIANVGLVTVTRVEVSGDLGIAWVAVVAHDVAELDAKARAARDQSLLEGFARASGMLRAMIARRLNTKKTPELRFSIDQRLDEELKLQALLREIGPADKPK
jgi:ribosome-binding factor A